MLVLFAGALVTNACRKDGELLKNKPPETKTSIDAINLTGEDRLNSLVNVSWWGSDPDGYLLGYEFSFDEEQWFFTSHQDSTFLFSIPKGSDTTDIDFWVRSVDNDSARDLTAAYLKIPLKNTPPEISFIDDLIPSDTVFNVLTMAWDASDADCFCSIEAIQLKINDGEWFEFDPLVETEETAIASLFPSDLSASGITDAKLVSRSQSDVGELSGLNVNGMNSIFIRAVDLAGSFSEPDTIENIFFRGRTNDVLVLGTSSSKPDAFYKSNMKAIGQSFDFIDWVDRERANAPKIWNPTFEILLKQYDVVVLYGKDDFVLNPQTSEENIILEFAATGMESYINGGGKMLISSSLPNLFSAESALFGILPIDSLSSSSGQARLPTDSLAVGLKGFPSLTSNALIGGLDPVYPSTDAEIIYTAQLTKANGWTGPEENAIGVRRRSGSNTSLIFISVELDRIDKDEAASEAFFRRVFNEEFNW
ncbi:MAG: hypothetical protein Salg2KO_05680 [Salibacteraceae bacterium]